MTIGRKGVGKVVKATPMPNLKQAFSMSLLGQAITAQRTGMKLRIVDVAEALSLSKQTMVKIEKGDTKVNLANVLKVMEYLGLSFQIIADQRFDSSKTNNASNNDECWF